MTRCASCVLCFFTRGVPLIQSGGIGAAGLGTGFGMRCRICGLKQHLHLWQCTSRLHGSW